MEELGASRSEREETREEGERGWEEEGNLVLGVS